MPALIYVLATWSKAGRTLTYDGRRRITRSKAGELSLAIDQVMTNDEGRYTLTLEPSDADAPTDMGPITLSTRVEVNTKLKGSRYVRENGSGASSRAASRARSLLNGRGSKDPF
ncbi:unnamed protein product [Dicrocoelium dendriticum]|nr:unnamed protein product [Dicrocoelium dendriticum]